MPTPFLGVAVLGSGGPAAAVDAYGSIVEMRAPGPAGQAVISTPYKRQRAGSVDAETGIVMHAAAGDRAPAPLWQSSPRQRYLNGGSVLETRARVAGVAVRARDAMAPAEPLWAREILVRPLQAAADDDARGNDSGPADAHSSSAQLEISLNFDFGEGESWDRVEDRRLETGARGSFMIRHGEQQVNCWQESRTKPRLTEDEGVVRLYWSSSARNPLRVFLLCRVDSASEAASEGPDASGSSAPSAQAEVERVHAAATADAHRALAAASSLPATAPAWAHHLHRRSLLALLAMSDRTTGATPAGLRDHWHYIWPRDAATVALALSEAGLTERAAAVADFIAGLDAENAARFNSDGSPVDDGRHEQGDGPGWVRLAERATAQPGDDGTETLVSESGSAATPREATVFPWRNQGDYGERDDDRGDYLANAIVAGAPAAEIEAEFAHDGLLVREAGTDNPADIALDTAAAWAVRPFPRPSLFPMIRPTLLKLAATAGPYGLFPASDWTGRDPWTAATASTAWSLAALGERTEALRLMRAVRDAATPLFLLPERADIENGLPRSTTPLAWSHAFALLALQELWPPV